VWVTARFDVLFKSLDDKLQKTIDIFLAHFHFLKKLQIFLMLLGIMHTAPSLTKISIDVLLLAAQTFGLKLA